MATRLKRLDLHGFKSFATPTSFVFDTGFTAIIGPNGSGKSNISDALRWVLGEQSYANLRGRRTEDIIFAGSSARAPLGMSEVTVTLDNEDGSLPVAFSDVAVTRRAYRSGENQYLINGARVRLRDVLQVTASLGQSHTVIGQGLVDAVLSQRADERRGLFEHAAGITGLRIKHASAGRNLEESQTNCTRLEDLLSDLEPRLRSLERAARQAREYDDVRQQLFQSLQRYYARQWQLAAARLERAEQAVESLADELDGALRDRDQRRAQLERVHQDVSERAAVLEGLRGDIQRLRDEHQRASHELALIDERQHSIRNRKEDAEQGLAGIEASLEELTRECRDLVALRDELLAESAAQEQTVSHFEAAQVESRQAIATLEAELSAAERRRDEHARLLLQSETRITLLRGRLDQLDAERSRLRTDTAERDERRKTVGAEAALIDASMAALTERLGNLASEMETLGARLAECSSERERLQARRSELERRIIDARTRFEALRRIEESGVGLYAGVRQVLDEARKGRLSGVLGTISSLLIVPAELEAAIEAALGGHLQDLVIERWSDAERCIEHLKQTQAGRATFHPLDTIRERQVARAPKSSPGVRGPAMDLIGMDERARPVVDGLLGRVLLAEDLGSARDALRVLPPGWSVVTIGGEIARSSGTVTGGARIKETGALARERELRELPRRLEDLVKRQADAEAEFDGVAQELSRILEHKAELERRVAGLRAELSGRSAERDSLRRQRDELDRAAGNARARVDALDEQITATERELEVLGGVQAEGDLILGQLEGETRRLREALSIARAALGEAEWHDARGRLSALRERLRSVEEQERRVLAQLHGLEDQREHDRARVVELDGAVRALDDARVTATGRRDELAAQVEQVRSRHALIQAEHEAGVSAEQDARRGMEAAEERCRELERRQDHLALDAARRRDELDLTIERAARDLEVDEVESILSASDAVDDDDLPKLERDIARLRERLRRIGLAGEDAVEQYEREAERYGFLRRQLDDVHTATEALRTLMNELERTMAVEFDRTFSEVARAFEETFTALFGGGRARLIRCDDDGAAGIDIVAQPPGKRLQNLGLLSGGERALTAVALLFSILKVNPSPFCLLDEVDAALDEANVVRVRDELRRLSEKTQFVVVTHNRSTIEGADTLYGITMGDDGVSRVLSLRMPVEAAS